METILFLLTLFVTLPVSVLVYMLLFDYSILESAIVGIAYRVGVIIGILIVGVFAQFTLSLLHVLVAFVAECALAVVVHQ